MPFGSKQQHGVFGSFPISNNTHWIFVLAAGFSDALYTHARARLRFACLALADVAVADIVMANIVMADRGIAHPLVTCADRVRRRVCLSGSNLQCTKLGAQP